jgi:hypothetical protein
MKNIYIHVSIIIVLCILCLKCLKYRLVEVFTQLPLNDDIYNIIDYTKTHLNTLNNDIDVNNYKILNKLCEKSKFYTLNLSNYDNDSSIISLRAQYKNGIYSKEADECISTDSSYRKELHCDDIQCLNRDFETITASGKNINNEKCTYEDCVGVCDKYEDCWIKNTTSDLTSFHKIDNLHNCQPTSLNENFNCISSDKIKECPHKYEYYYTDVYDVNSLSSNVVDANILTFNDTTKYCSYDISDIKKCPIQKNTSKDCYYKSKNDEEYILKTYPYNFGSCSFEEDINCLKKEDLTCQSNTRYEKNDELSYYDEKETKYHMIYDTMFVNEKLSFTKENAKCVPSKNMKVPECKFSECYSMNSNDELTNKIYNSVYNHNTNECVFDNCYSKNKIITLTDIELKKKADENDEMIFKLSNNKTLLRKKTEELKDIIYTNLTYQTEFINDKTLIETDISTYASNLEKLMR